MSRLSSFKPFRDAYPGGLLAGGLIFGTALAFHGWYAGHGLAMFDTGMLVSDAARLLRGEVFGRDFMAPYGPARDYLLAGIFKLFGPSLLTLAWTFAVLRALADLLTYRLARGFLPPGAALLPAALVAVAHGSLHKTFLALAALAVLGPLLRHVVRMRRSSAALLGAGLGAAFLMRYDVGVFSSAAAGVMLLVQFLAQPWLRKELRGHLAAIVLGAFAVVGPVALLLLFAGLRPSWWWEMTWQRISIQEAITSLFPWPLEQFRSGHKFAALTGIYLFASPVIVLAGLVQSWRWCRRSDRRLQGVALAPVAVLALLLLNQARLVPSFNHFLQGAMPLFVTGAVVLWSVLGRLRRRGGWAADLARVLYLLPLGVLTLHVALGTHGTHPGSFTVRERDDVFLSGPRAGIRVPPYQAAEIEGVVKAIAAHSGPNDRIVCPHSSPVFAFLADRPAALPFSEPSYYYRNEQVQRRLVDGLRDRPARLFIYDPNPVVGYTMDADAGILLEALRSTMEPVARVGRYVVYLRR